MEETERRPNQMCAGLTTQQEEERPAAKTLPYEMIYAILFQVLSDWDKPYDSRTAPMRAEARRAIVCASQVCQRWRSVALKESKLWMTIINIDTNSSSWVKELLRRSGNRPLKIESDTRMDTSSVFTNRGYRADKWTQVFTQMNRIQVFHLRLHRRAGNSLTPLVEALSQPAPMMESLQVESDAQKFGGIADKVLATRTWPANLFGGNAPNLRELVVRGMGLSAYLPNSRAQLTSLSFSGISGESFSSPSEWLDVLDAQPQLSHLCINAVHHVYFERVIGSRQVILPHLEFLEISGQQEFINQLYPRIIVPRNKGGYVLRLASFCPFVDLNNDGILQGLSSLFQSMEGKFPRWVWKINWLSNCRLIIEAALPSAFADSCDPTLRISFYLHRRQADATIIRIFELIRSMDLMRETRGLGLKFDDWLSEDAMLAFISLLHSCRKVSNLILMGAFTVRAFLKYVSLDSSRSNDTADSSANRLSTILFPNLQYLVYNEDRDEFHRVHKLIFSFCQWRHKIGRRIPIFWMCVHQHEAMTARIRNHLDKTTTPRANLMTTLSVSGRKGWDVALGSHFPRIF